MIIYKIRTSFKTAKIVSIPAFFRYFLAGSDYRIFVLFLRIKVRMEKQVVMS